MSPFNAHLNTKGDNTSVFMDYNMETLTRNEWIDSSHEKCVKMKNTSK